MSVRVSSNNYSNRFASNTKLIMAWLVAIKDVAVAERQHLVKSVKESYAQQGRRNEGEKKN